MKFLKFRTPKDIFAANLLFIFVFLNIWDFAVSRKIFNAMPIGIIIFSVPAILWLVGKMWSIAMLTLISVVQFLIIGVLLLQGIQISGAGITTKTFFFLPFLAMTVLNMVWGLKFYGKFRRP